MRAGTERRLRFPRIETKPKKVEAVGDRLDVRIALTRAQQDDLRALVRLIQAGSAVPQRYYRPSRSRRGDELLVKDGIMHLHLAGPSDALVYLIQYEASVLIVCVDSHVHLHDQPPGKKLNAYQISRAEKKRGS